MLSTLKGHTPAIGAVLVASLLLGASLVGPAVGAPSPLSVAKKALKTAKKANKTATSANKRSKTALSAASSAKTTASSASAAAGGASRAASSASTKADRALSTANAAAATSGPGAIGFGSYPDVPTDGTPVEDVATCPAGFLPVGGGVRVFDSDGPVTSGIAITESGIDLDALGWRAAVQDTDNSSDRVMEVTVQCAKPSALSFKNKARK